VTLSISPGIPLNWLSISNVSDRAVFPNVIAPGTKVIIEHFSSLETRINFQPDSEPAPDGNVKDTGAPFDAARGYGWTADITRLAHVRNIHADPRFDTLIQFGGEGSAWELALPSPGRYRVRAYLGDPASESIYDLSIEKAWAVSGLYLPAGEFREVAKDVDLTDGRVTLYGGSIYGSTRIAYVRVLPVYLDGDADLIDDVWEISYFGSVEACDPNADPDSDGASNYEEFLARTNPLSFPFRVNRLAPSSSHPDWLEITWTDLGVPDATYTIQWSHDLVSWNTFTPDPADVLVNEQEKTITWVDKGTAPGMGGLPPGQVKMRFYKVTALAVQGE
jgi:hypothetical protein